MKTSDYMDLQLGVADIMSALPRQFDHPGHAVAALAQAMALHCRLWGIPEPIAVDLLSSAFAEYKVLQH